MLPIHQARDNFRPLRVVREPARCLPDDEFRAWLKGQADGACVSYETNSPPDCHPSYQFEGEEPRPSYEDDIAEPTPEDDAWRAGFFLGMEGEYAGPPEHYSGRLPYWFTHGRLSGWQLSPEGQDWIADMEAMRDRADDHDHHDDERIRVLGCIEARKGAERG